MEYEIIYKNRNGRTIFNGIYSGPLEDLLTLRKDPLDQVFRENPNVVVKEVAKHMKSGDPFLVRVPEDLVPGGTPKLVLVNSKDISNISLPYED